MVRPWQATVTLRQSAKRLYGRISNYYLKHCSWGWLGKDRAPGRPQWHCDSLPSSLYGTITRNTGAGVGLARTGPLAGHSDIATVCQALYMEGLVTITRNTGAGIGLARTGPLAGHSDIATVCQLYGTITWNTGAGAGLARTGPLAGHSDIATVCQALCIGSLTITWNTGAGVGLARTGPLAGHSDIATVRHTGVGVRLDVVSAHKIDVPAQKRDRSNRSTEATCRTVSKCHSNLQYKPNRFLPILFQNQFIWVF